MIESAILSSVLGMAMPALTDAFSSIVQRLTGGSGALPKNVDDVIKLQTADVERLKALAELDKPEGNVDRWVANLRASFRPIIAVSAFAIGVSTMFVKDLDPDVAANIFSLATMVTSYMFGERFIFGSRGFGKNK